MSIYGNNGFGGLGGLGAGGGGLTGPGDLDIVNTGVTVDDSDLEGARNPPDNNNDRPPPDPQDQEPPPQSPPAQDDPPVPERPSLNASLFSLVEQNIEDMSSRANDGFNLLSTHILRKSTPMETALDYLSKSSRCQDAIINKFYSNFFEENEIQVLVDKIRQTKSDVDNIADSLSIKDFSYFLSLIDNSYKFFSGEGTDFSYALNSLNMRTQDFSDFLSVQTNQQNFINVYKHIVGYNNRNDSIPERAGNINAISTEDATSISENTAILSLTQKLNTTIFSGDSLSLHHSTTSFKNTTNNDRNNLLTFDKRADRYKNIIIGTDNNLLCRSNTTLGFNLRNSSQLSRNIFSNEILEDRQNVSLNVLNSDSMFDRNIDLINLDLATAETPDLYKPFMKALLKTNCSITNVGVRTVEQTSQYFGRNELSFIKSSNIEINNILFGIENSRPGSLNLSKFIANTRKNISLARSSLSYLKKDTFIESESYLDRVFNSAYQESSNSLHNTLGVTNTRQTSSIVNRSETRPIENLFLKNNIDIFETNDILAENPGFAYFTRANIEEIDSVIETHASELQKVETSIDSYYENKLTGKDLYTSILSHASIGVEKSLERFNESTQFEYGNLPVHLLESVAFISRYTGNKNFKKQSLTHNQREFKDLFNILLLHSVKNNRLILSIKDSIIGGINDRAVNSVLRLLNAPTNARNEISRRFNSEFFNLVQFINSISKFFFGEDEYNRPVSDFRRIVPENDFRRYAKDGYNRGRNGERRNILPSPRYFLVCGIPFIDIYTSNRKNLRDEYIRNYGQNNDVEDNSADRNVEFYLKEYAEGFNLVYYPFVGFVSLGADQTFDNGYARNRERISDINSLYKVLPQDGILSQLLLEKDGIISEYIKFLTDKISDIDVNLNNLNGPKEKNILSFIENSFLAYCNFVISKLSQTFEYSTTLSAIKLFSEGPMDVHRGVDPLYHVDRQINHSSVYIKSNADPDSLTVLQRSRNLIDSPNAFVHWLANTIDNNITIKNWFFPRNNDGQYYPVNQVFINYYDKISSSNHRQGWGFTNNVPSVWDEGVFIPRAFPDNYLFNNPHPRKNQIQGKPSLISNVLGTLYFDSPNLREVFLEYFEQQEYTDEINKENVPTFGLEVRSFRGISFNFSGSTFMAELVCTNAQQEAEGLLDLNDNEYLQDLIDESNHFLYAKNSNDKYRSIDRNLYDSDVSQIFYGGPDIADDDPNWPKYIDNTTRVSYFSQYNINYPIIHQKLYIKNVYSGLVKPSYTLMQSKTSDTFFPDISFEEYSDAVFNPLIKIYNGLLAEDISIAYLFDSVRYIFKHMKEYKRFLEEEPSEEVNESVQRITELLSNQYDRQDTFSINRYLQKINLNQKRLIDINLDRLEQKVSSNILFNNRQNYDIAKRFFNEELSLTSDTIVLCVGIKRRTIANSRGDFTISVNLFDSMRKLNSESKNYRFNINGGNGVSEAKSLRAKNYLTSVSGFSIDENSLFLDLYNNTAQNAESPRIFANRLERLNNHAITLNSEYQALFDQEELVEEDGFLLIDSNVDFNIKNDVYTNIIDTDKKIKKDIYNRILKADYKLFTNGGLAESIMPKEFIKVVYIPIHLRDFVFREGRQIAVPFGGRDDRPILRGVLGNNYSISVSVRAASWVDLQY